MTRTSRWVVAVLAGCGLAAQAGCGKAPAPAAEEVVPRPEDRVAFASFERPVARGQAPDEERPKPPKDEPPATDGFRFPEDRGGELLARLLPPTLPPATDPPGRQRRLLSPSAVEQPTLPLPPVPAQPPRLPPSKPKRPARPGPVPEELPLVGPHAAAALPQAQTLPAGKRVKAAGPDVTQPPPLPILSPQPAAERASFDDPTAEASQAAALARSPAPRATAAPFLRLFLPDPFENAHTARLRNPPPEDPAPAAATPRTPNRP
ncbi:MAG TPA: hypothetical protein VFA26_13955 [Gemmataceae bacterium]|nr:hypothetical protein [Gemmataceae bacterium]